MSDALQEFEEGLGKLKETSSGAFEHVRIQPLEHGMVQIGRRHRPHG